jgi:hypothetical protein
MSRSHYCQVQWLMCVTLVTWKVWGLWFEASLGKKSVRPISTKIWVWWYIPVMPTTWRKGRHKQEDWGPGQKKKKCKALSEK